MSRLTAFGMAGGILLVTLVAAEMALTVFAPVDDPYEAEKYEQIVNGYIRSAHPVRFRMTTETEEGLPGIEGPKRFTTNNVGLRGDSLAMPKPRDEFRIFVLGGSAAEGFYLDDSEAIHAVAQEALQERASGGTTVRVYNAARSGDASDDHLSMLVHRLVHLHPDMVVVLAGVDDLVASMNDYDYTHYTTTDMTGYDLPTLLRLLLTELQLPRRIHYLFNPVDPAEQTIQEGIQPRSNYREKVALARQARLSSRPPAVDAAPYARNLATLIGVAEAQDIEVVLVTQQSTWGSEVDSTASEWHWMLRRNGVRHREDEMDEALGSFNDALREVARTHDVPVLDLARRVPKTTRHFYDDVHFTVEGACVAGRTLAEFLATEALVPGVSPGGGDPEEACRVPGTRVHVAGADGRPDGSDSSKVRSP